MTSKALVIALLLGAATAVSAQNAPPRDTQMVDPARSFARASASLTDRLGTAQSGRAAVGMSDSATHDDLAAIDRAMADFPSDCFAVDGIDTFDSVCGALNALNIRYALDGLPAYRHRGGSATGPAILTFMSRNIVRFQNETAILTDRLVQCQAAHIPALTAMIAILPPEQLTPTRIDGLHGLRRGQANMIAGIMLNARDPAMREANRMRLLQSAARWIGPFSAIMPLAERDTLSRTIAEMQPGLTGNALAQQESVAAALADRQCAGLCLIP